MNLKAPCPHGRYDEHVISALNPSADCPGGSLLPPDSLVVVKEDGEWPEATVERVALVLLDLDGQSLDGLIGSWVDELVSRYRPNAVVVLDAINAHGTGEGK